MIGGRFVLERGRFPGIDVAALRAKIADRVADLRDKTREQEILALQLEEIVGNFCIGLARTPYPIERRLPQGY